MSASDATERFYQWVWPHRAAVLRAARVLTGRADEADDLAQETLFKAFRAIDQFQPGSNMKAWLMTILRHTRIDRLRAAGLGKEVSLDQMELDAPEERVSEPERLTPQEVLEDFSDQQIIAALGELPEDIRWTLLLVDVQGQELKDAAQALEVPVGTIKSRLHRGRRMLRDALADHARQLRLA